MGTLESVLPPDQPPPVQKPMHVKEDEPDIVSPLTTIGLVFFITAATMLVMYCLFSRSSYGKWAKQRHSFKWVTAPAEPGEQPRFAVRVWLPQDAPLTIPKHLEEQLALQLEKGMARKPEIRTEAVPSPPESSPPLLPKVAHGSCPSKDFSGAVPTPPESPSKACVGIGIPSPPEGLPPMLLKHPRDTPQEHSTDREGERHPQMIRASSDTSLHEGPARCVRRPRASSAPCQRRPANRAADVDALLRPPQRRPWSQSAVESRARDSRPPPQHQHLRPQSAVDCRSQDSQLAPQHHQLRPHSATDAQARESRPPQRHHIRPHSAADAQARDSPLPQQHRRIRPHSAAEVQARDSRVPLQRHHLRPFCRSELLT